MAAIALSGFSPSVASARGSGEQASTSGSSCPPSQPFPRGFRHRRSASVSGAFPPVQASRGGASARSGRGNSRNFEASAYGPRHEFTGSWAEDSFEELGDLAFHAQLPEFPRRVANTNTRTSSSTARTTSSSGGGQERRSADKGYQPRSSLPPPSHNTIAWDRSHQGHETGDPGRTPGFELDNSKGAPSSASEPTSRTPFPAPSSSCDASGRQSHRKRRDNSASQEAFGNDDPSGSLPPFAANGIEPWSLCPVSRSPSSVALVSSKGPAKGLYDGLKEVFVILFGVGEEGHEGIYSLRAIDRDDGLPHDTIIAFEDQTDAERYAGQLDGTFRAFSHLPSVCSIPPEELLDFCVDAGYNCRLEPAGSHLLPPDFNVGTTDWERSLRLRNGNFAVLDHEPQFDINGLVDETFKFGGLTELDRQKLQLERLLVEIGPDSAE